MIQHFFKIAFRNILKYRTQSIISIIGLAVGFTCFALANLWIHYDTTYDAYHEGCTSSAKKIYLEQAGIPLICHIRHQRC